MFKSVIRNAVDALGFEIQRKRKTVTPPYKWKGFDAEFEELARRSAPLTMTSEEKMFALFRAINYLESNRVPGPILECGVAAGGSMVLAALTLLSRRSSDRELWLFDTFAGMPGRTFSS